MIPMTSIAVLSSQAFIYTTLLDNLFYKDTTCAGFDVLTIFNLSMSITGIALMLMFANIADIKYSISTLEFNFNSLGLFLYSLLFLNGNQIILIF